MYIGAQMLEGIKASIIMPLCVEGGKRELGKVYCRNYSEDVSWK